MNAKEIESVLNTTLCETKVLRINERSEYTFVDAKVIKGFGIDTTDIMRDTGAVAANLNFCDGLLTLSLLFKNEVAQ